MSGDNANQMREREREREERERERGREREREGERERERKRERESELFYPNISSSLSLPIYYSFSLGYPNKGLWLIEPKHGSYDREKKKSEMKNFSKRDSKMSLQYSRVA